MKKRKVGRPRLQGTARNTETLHIKMSELISKRLARLENKMNGTEGVRLSRSAIVYRAMSIGMTVLEEDPGKFFGDGE